METKNMQLHVNFNFSVIIIINLFTHVFLPCGHMWLPLLHVPLSCGYISKSHVFLFHVLTRVYHTIVSLSPVVT